VSVRTVHSAAADRLNSRPERLRVLFVAKRFPYPADTGGKIRTARLLELLSRRLDITLVSNVEHPKDDPYLAWAHKLCGRFESVPWREIAKSSPQFYARVLRRLGSRYPVSVASDYSPDFAERIRTCLAKDRYDLLVCDFVQPSINIGDDVECPMLLFQHNVESMIFERHARTAGNAPLRWFWRSQWRKMERFEQEACARFAGVVAVSETDRALFAKRFGARRTFAIPTAVDAEYFRPGAAPVVDGRIVFTGSMDWLPNEDAVLFFADEILPRIRTRVPEATFIVVGRSPSRRLLRRLGERSEITITGRVDDVRPHLERATAYVIPLRIGGGTRIKAYEAMAMAKSVVSTSIGVEGLPVRDGEHVVLADRPEDFADAVVDLLQQPERRDQLGQAARRFVEGSFTWPSATEAFIDACRAVAFQEAQRSIPGAYWEHRPRPNPTTSSGLE
jgi:sugar transferase (PEP-CTERM/EpsH1 system associated)